MTIKPFTGVLTALATPFGKDLSIDLVAFRKMLQMQRDAGLHGVVVCGTTGESPTLSKDEKELLVKTALEYQTDSFRIHVGTGSYSTQETIESSRHFSTLKVQGQTVAGIMVVTPYYNKPNQTGLKEHFLAVAKSVPTTPVCLYNVPGRTGCALQPKTLVAIASEAKNIVAIKEAAGDIRVVTDMNLALEAAGLSQQVGILSGDDPTFAPAMMCGASGVISVTTHLIPGAMLAIWKAAQNGDFKSLCRLHADTYPVNTQLFCAPNPIPLKWALAELNCCQNTLRPPMTILEEAEIVAVRQALEAVKSRGIQLLK